MVADWRRICTILPNGLCSRYRGVKRMLTGSISDLSLTEADMKGAKIGIIGDFDAEKRSHLATDDAIRQAAGSLGITADVRWCPTAALEEERASFLAVCDAVWCSPGSPYQSFEGALLGIRLARERDVPYIGT